MRGGSRGALTTFSYNATTPTPGFFSFFLCLSFFSYNVTPHDATTPSEGVFFFFFFCLSFFSYNVRRRDAMSPFDVMTLGGFFLFFIFYLSFYNVPRRVFFPFLFLLSPLSLYVSGKYFFGLFISCDTFFSYNIVTVTFTSHMKQMMPIFF
jgi:hypothetical protein